MESGRMEVKAVVVQVLGAQRMALVRVPKVRCASCATSGGCGLSSGGDRIMSIPVPLDQRIMSGDEIVVEIDDQSVHRAAVSAYLAPTFFAIVAAAAGQRWGGDVWAIAMAFLGVALGWGLARSWHDKETLRLTCDRALG